MQLITRYLADKEFETINESGNRLPIDMHAPADKQHFSPMQLLLAATGACAAVDIIEILKKKRKTVWDLQIKSEGIRRDEIPKRFNRISLHFILYSPNTGAEEFLKVVRLGVEKYCSVSASLAPDIELVYSVEVINEQPVKA